MKNKIIRLTENDIQNLVQKIIKESYSDQELLLQVDDISEILGHEDMVGAFSDLAEAVAYLEDEMYDGNHGSIMTKKIEDLLTQIYEVIGWPDDEEFEDEDYMSKKPDLLKTVLKAMVDNNLISPSKVNIYDDNFEVYGFNGPNFDYFMDNHIIFEKGGESEVFLNFEMYEEDVDMQDALKVSDWLYPKLQAIFGDEIFFMDNLDDEDYMQDMSKPGIGQKLKQGLRDLSGLSNKNDSETLAQIHNLIQKGMVDNVRRQSVDSITAWLNNKALIVDRGRNPEIIYAGRNLEIANLESEADDLYSELITHL